MAFILGLIPARGGSKGIKNKNIVKLAGKPLIAYTIEAARESGLFNALILSTDSPDIAKAALESGLPCGALRPAHLSTDEAKTSDVLRHELEQYEAEHNHKVDTLILLQPTTPLRTIADIQNAYKAYLASGQKSLISCYDAQAVHPSIMYKKQGDKLMPYMGDGALMRRQEMPDVYVRNGALYIVDRDYFLETGRAVSETPALYEMPRERSVNIDVEDDIALAEFYLERKYLK